VAFKATLERADSKVCRLKTLQQAQQEPLPEDVFLLPALPLAADTPCVVMLREIVGVSNDAVCFRATDATTTDSFLRVCRLQPTYKYAVSQAFGILYSRIGLPDEYERRCRDVVSGIASFEWE
jgi:ubiquitin